MKIKTYLVSSLAEAIERIKRDLGPEAIILSTKKTVLSDKWWNRDSGLEVTAAIDLPVKNSENLTTPVSTTGQTMRIVSQLTEKMAEKQISPIKDEISRLRESLEQMMQLQKDNSTLLQKVEASVESIPEEIKAESKLEAIEPFEKELEEAPSAEDSVRYVSAEKYLDEKPIPTENISAILESLATQVLKSPATISTPCMTTTPAYRMIPAITPQYSEKELSPQIAQQIECVSQEWLSEIHRQRKYIYEISLDLLSHRLKIKTVQSVTNYLLETNPDGSRMELREQAASWLMEHLPECKPFTVNSERQNIIAMIGPTGSGKTTTLVKLASQLVLEQKQSIAFISLDNQRVGAREQLRRHAAILKAPCLYARTPLQFQKALKSLEHFTVVLIDTAGCSPNDDRAVWELHQTLSCDQPVWKALVLPATLQEPDMSRTIRKFAPARCNHLVVTKLDETSCFGTLYNAPAQSNLIPAYFTMGQQIPEDIEPATKERIVDCLLHFSDFSNEQIFENSYTEDTLPARDLQ